MRLLDAALVWLDEEGSSLSREFIVALKSRLGYRRSFLEAVGKGLGVIDNISTHQWQNCITLLPSLEQSMGLGNPVEESFSVKLQRKLASTVPPRPIVSTSFGEAHTFLKRLCQDGKDVVRVLDYRGTNNMLVSHYLVKSVWKSACHVDLSFLEFHLGVSVA